MDLQWFKLSLFSPSRYPDFPIGITSISHETFSDPKPCPMYFQAFFFRTLGWQLENHSRMSGLSFPNLWRCWRRWWCLVVVVRRKCFMGKFIALTYRYLSPWNFRHRLDVQNKEQQNITSVPKAQEYYIQISFVSRNLIHLSNMLQGAGGNRATAVGKKQPGRERLKTAVKRAPLESQMECEIPKFPLMRFFVKAIFLQVSSVARMGRESHAHKKRINNAGFRWFDQLKLFQQWHYIVTLAARMRPLLYTYIPWVAEKKQTW